MRVILAVGISSLFVVLVGAASPTPFARAGCNPNRPVNYVTYTAGADRQPGVSVGGVYSQIYNYPDPYTYGTTGYSELYVNAKNGPIFGRVGWREWNYPTNNYRVTRVAFKLSASGSSFTAINITPAQPQWQFSYYTVLHNRQNPGTYTFQVNGNTVYTVGGSQAIPLWGQAKGETYQLPSQMPGGYQDSSFFYNTYIWYNDAWQVFNGTNQFTLPYHYSYGSGLYYTIEDLYCP